MMVVPEMNMVTELAMRMETCAADLRLVRINRAEARAQEIDEQVLAEINVVREAAEAEAANTILELEQEIKDAVHEAKIEAETEAFTGEFDEYDTRKWIANAVKVAEAHWAEKMTKVKRDTTAVMAETVNAVLKPAREKQKVETLRVKQRAMVVPVATPMESVAQQLLIVAQASHQVGTLESALTVNALTEQAVDVAQKAQRSVDEAEESIQGAKDIRMKSLRNVKNAKLHAKKAADNLKAAADTLKQATIDKNNATAYEQKMKLRLEQADEYLAVAHKNRKDVGEWLRTCGAEKRRASSRAFTAKWNVKAAELITSQARGAKEAAANELVRA